jgi:hypothetical protein
MKGTLTKNAPRQEGLRINGEAALALYGGGAVRLLRQLGDGPYLPLTDASGEQVEFFSEDVLFNGDITNKCPQARFALELMEGTKIDFTILEC